MRILVVEDNAMNMELMTDLLEMAGLSVSQAVTAEEGIRRALSDKPDLILMDVSLPGLDGLSATRRLKEDPLTSAIPVVAVTAHAMTGDRERVEQAGCAGYITKPIDERTFVQELTGFLAEPPNP